MANFKDQRLVSQYIADKINNGTGRSVIEAELVGQGLEERFVKDMVQESFKLHYAKKRAKGLSLILIGALICFISFLLTITSTSIQGNFSLVLYGLTSAGILVVFAGFTMIF
jgi:hypothetical protein